MRVAAPPRGEAVPRSADPILEVSGRLLEGKPSGELPRVMVEAGDVVLDELERVGLIAAAEKRARILPAAFGEAELDAPARDGLLEICHPQTHVVDPAGSYHRPVPGKRHSRVAAISCIQYPVFVSECKESA